MSSTENVAKYTRETVTAVHHWDSPGLVSVRVTRPIGFQFLPGQFARLGLPNDDNTGEPSIWRAYSMVTHPHENALEFLSVTVPQGQFSPRLAKLVPGDALWIEKAPFGFLTLDRFEPADSLWLVATGTGLSAFLPMLDDDDTWRRFGRVILVHGARTARELAYCESLLALAAKRPEFVYVPILSREPWFDGRQAPCRVTKALEDGQLENVTDISLNPQTGRIMLCGNPQMVTDMRAMLAARGFAAGRRGNPGTLAVENYW